MASWRDNEEDFNYTLDQVLKKIDHSYTSKSIQGESIDYGMYSEETSNKFEE